MSIKNHEWDQQRADTSERVDMTDINYSGEHCGSSKTQVGRDLVSLE
jgi:hypothetical protein